METMTSKDTNFDWIKRIPNNWNTLSLLYVLRKPITDGPHETPNYVDDGIPFISVDSLNDGEEIDLSVVRRFISEEDFKKYEMKTKLENQDLLFTKAATIGKTAIVNTNEKFMIWSPLALIKPDENKINYKFLYYVLSSEEYINYVIRLGSFNTQSNVGMRTLEKSKIPLPASVREQELIVSYLDKKCSKIDCIINNLEKQIEILEKYKKSVINEAVTKGLNLGVEMKDSGIDWIGYIPVHWQTIKVKYLVKILNGKEIGNDEGEIPVYGSGGLFKFTDKWLYDGISVLLGRKGTIDSPQLVNGKFWTVDTAFFTRFTKDINPEFFFYISKCFDYSKYQSGSTIPSMTQSILGNISIPKVKIEEQNQIVTYLNEKCSEINLVIQNKKQQIETIKKYKNSLIYEYVTGKKRVGQGDVNE